MLNKYIVHYGNPVYVGPPDTRTIHYIQSRFVWDSDNDFGFGCGVIVDSLSTRPVTEPLDWKKCRAS